MNLFKRFLSFDQVKATVLRFPLALLSSTGVTALMLWNIYNEYTDTPEWMERLMPALFVGILLFGGLALLAEGLKLRSWLVQLLGIPVLYLLIYSVPNFDMTHVLLMLRIGMVFVASLALIFVGPFLRGSGDKQNKGLWNFGMQTWFRALQSIVASVALVIGLTIALFSIEQLFEVTVDYRLHEMIPVFFFVFVASCFFYTGLAKNHSELWKEAPAEKAIRAVSHFVSFPLLLVYFLILSVYIVKILATQIWPTGWVATPVLLFTLLGYGTYILVHPLKDDKGNRLIRFFSRVFPWTSFPFLAVYFVALWLRIDPYGVTHTRYIAVLVGLLITFWSINFAFRKKTPLKIIPASIVLAGLLLNFGPWGVGGVSRASQFSHLEALLEGPVEDDTAREVSAKVDYLLDNFGSEVFVPMLGEGAIGMEAPDVVDALGFSYVSGWGTVYEGKSGTRFYSWTDNIEPLEISGYDYAFTYYEELFPSQEISYVFPDGKGEVMIAAESEEAEILVEYDGLSYKVPLEDFLFALQADSSLNETQASRERLSLTADFDTLSILFAFNSLSFRSVEDEIEELHFDANVFVDIK